METLTVGVTLPTPVVSDPGSSGWYATLQLKNRSNTSLPSQFLTTAYNTTSVHQELSFTNHLDCQNRHFDNTHEGFAVAVCIKFYRYGSMFDMTGECMDTRHFPLTANHFDKNSATHEAVIKSFREGSLTSYLVKISVDWEDREANSTLEEMQAAAQSAAAGEGEGVDGGIYRMLDELKIDLTKLGINVSSTETEAASASDADRMETDAICKLAVHFYNKRKVLSLDPPVELNVARKPIYLDGWLLMCYWRGFGNEARSALTATCKWRAAENINTLRTQSLFSIIGCKRATFDPIYSAGLMGFTALGEPIIARRFGQIDMKKMEKMMGQWETEGDGQTRQMTTPPSVIDLFYRAHIWEMEWFSELIRNQCFRHKTHIKSIVVLDLKGCGMKQFSRDVMSMIKLCIGSDSNHYPDSLKKLYIINSPGFFSFIWKIVKPHLHPVVVAKVAILSKASEVKEALEMIPVEKCCLSMDVGGGEAVPVEGATCEGCFIPFGGWGGAANNEVEKWSFKTIKEDIRVANRQFGCGSPKGNRWKTGVPGVIGEDDEEDEEEEGSSSSSSSEGGGEEATTTTPAQEKEELKEIVKLLIIMMALCVVVFFIASTNQQCPSGMRCNLKGAIGRLVNS